MIKRKWGKNLCMKIKKIFRPLMKLYKFTEEYIDEKLRPPLESDNRNVVLKVNRFLANPIILIIVIFLLTYALWLIANVFFNIGAVLSDIVSLYAKTKNLDMLKKQDNLFTFDNIFNERGNIKGLWKLAVYGIIAAIDIKFAYDSRISYSDKAMNKGNYGTSRWTTVSEIKQQYKAITIYPSEVEEIETTNLHYSVEYEDEKPVIVPNLYDEKHRRILRIICDHKTGKPIKTVIRKSTNYFPGKGGVPISRWRDLIYIDSKLTNNLFIGATRSGKGEMFVFQLIDNYSRAERQIDRPSQIIFDPKLELYKSSAQTLKDRGYEVRLLNLDNPIKSAGYNPLAIITEYFKAGKMNEAEQLAKSFSFSIFNSSKDAQEAIWKNTSTDLFTALIISVVSDSISLDEELNYRRRDAFIKLKKIFEDEKHKDSRELRREKFIKIYEKDPELIDILNNGTELFNTLFMNDIGIPDYIMVDGKKITFDTVEPIYPNELKVNCFSVINFFQRLVNISSDLENNKKRGAEKAEVALDEYFNARPNLDYAKALYSSIKTAGDRTKGSIYVNMQSSLTIFAQDNMARLTAESDIDIKSLGFDKEKPTAVFIGIPTEDKSNHFIAVNFVTQVFQYLWKIAKEEKQVLDREVTFILDEFGNMPVLDNFASMVTNCLGAGISFNIFIQSYNQLKSNYEADEETIKDNFANQFYIMAVGMDSAEEFSKQLGNKTVIELQRSGFQFSKKKSFLENSKERPLKFPRELVDFREGETAVYRVSKRTDKAGAAIKNHPILNEYQDNIYFHHKIFVFIDTFCKRVIQKDIGKDRDTKKPLTFLQEYKLMLSEEKRWQGTAFLYRYQYMQDDFPNPTEIEFNKVFNEKGRENIDYQRRVVDIVKVLHKLGISEDVVEEVLPMDTPFRFLTKEKKYKFDNFASIHLGIDYRDKIRFSNEELSKNVLEKIKVYVDELDVENRNMLKKIDFIGQLQKIIIM
ncbi:MAG: type IV secretory system conjugative DNA transfer family protein [Hornefia sp.]|nr:type IV secretory system conjugative DNA transfer family protein [Hornefia sp.]